jgi:YD repeat-containing protein
MTSITDGRTIVYLTNEYTNGRVTKQTLASGGTYQFAYTVDGNGNVTQTDVTNPRGYVKRLTFNGTHRITAVTEAYGTALARTTTTERQAGTDFVTATVDGLSRRTEWIYDSASGRVLTMTQLAGTGDAVTTTYTYEPVFHQPATVTDRLGHTWTTSYDAAGRVTGTTDPLWHQTTVAMNGAGQVTSVTDPLAHTTQVGYLGGDLRAVIDPMRATTCRTAPKTRRRPAPASAHRPRALRRRPAAPSGPPARLRRRSRSASPGIPAPA